MIGTRAPAPSPSARPAPPAAAPRLELRDVIKSTDVEDPVNVHVHRPLQLVLARPLLRTSITPNQVTLLSLCSGLAAAACIFVGTPAALLAGALLLFGSAILDGVDGMIARAKKLSSEAGHALDGAADYAVNIATTAAAIWHLGRTTGHPWIALALGVAAHLAWAHHLMAYDFHCAAYLRFLTGGRHMGGDQQRATESLARVRARYEAEPSAGGFLQLSLMRIFVWQLGNRQALLARINPRGVALAAEPADGEQAARYVAAHRGPMRLWALLGNAPHVDSMVLAALVDRFDVYFGARIVLFTIIGFVATAWERRLHAREQSGTRAIGWTVDKVRRAVLGVLALTGVFYAPSLWGGYMCDDHFHMVTLEELGATSWKQRFDLFGLIKAAEELPNTRRFGLIPWWGSDDLRINFYRPIPSITHWLDFATFGRNPMWAHFCSILFYLAAVYVFYRVMARFLPPASRALLVATAVFALDDAHALNVVWIANRNESIAGAFVMLGMLAWLRLREAEQSGRRRWYHAALIVLAFGAALLSKESSILLPVFIALHALFFPDVPRGGEQPEGPVRLANLKKHFWLHALLFAVAIGFVAAYFAAGRGPNSAYYINPIKNPSLWTTQFFRSGFFHAVIMATGVPLHILSSSPVREYPAVAAALGLATVVFWVVAWRWLKKDRAFGYFLACMIVSQALLTTSFPDPRILFLPSIGFAYVVARLMQEAWRRRADYRPARWAFAALCVLHLAVAPVLDQVCTFVVNGFQGRYRTLRDSLAANIDYAHLGEPGADGTPAPETQVFFLNWHQREMAVLYGLYLRKELPTGVADISKWTHDDSLSYNEKMRLAFGAERIHYFSLSLIQGDGVATEQVGDRELMLTATRGHFFSTLFEVLYTTGEPYRPGQTFDNGVFRATVEEVAPGNEVKKVRFTFPEPLSSPRYRFMRYDGQRFVPVQFDHRHAA
jgi:phosphatidylglycerophosphate synthase